MSDRNKRPPIIFKTVAQLISNGTLGLYGKGLSIDYISVITQLASMTKRRHCPAAKFV